MDSIYFYLSSDSDEDKVSLRRVRRNIRTNTDDFFELPEHQFIKNFRLNKEGFRYVLSELEKKLPSRSRSTSIQPRVKLASCFRFFAEGGFQHGVGQDFNIGVAQSTFSVMLSEVLNILEDILCPKWINLHMSEQEKRDAKLYFYEKSNIPGVVMCVDGTHIKIFKPNENCHHYYNRKGYYSLNTMIICDHKGRIRYVKATHPGASHDAFIWKNSDAANYFKTLYDNGNRNIRILGDSAYPLLPWLITPFRNVNVNSRESRFNKSHSSGRNVVERTIGVWKNWCRCLLAARQLHYSPEKVVQIINVTAALHNIRIYYNVPDEDYLDEYNYIEENEQNIIQDDQYFREATDIRNQILNNF